MFEKAPSSSVSWMVTCWEIPKAFPSSASSKEPCLGIVTAKSSLVIERALTSLATEKALRSLAI